MKRLKAFDVSTNVGIAIDCCHFCVLHTDENDTMRLFRHSVSNNDLAFVESRLVALSVYTTLVSRLNTSSTFESFSEAAIKPSGIADEW